MSEHREGIMRQWDNIRAIIASGNTGSYPRDWFESVLDVNDEEISALRSENEKLKALLTEIDRRIPFESFGMGNTFSDSIECFLQHGGQCPTVQEAYAGTSQCSLHSGLFEEPPSKATLSSQPSENDA